MESSNCNENSTSCAMIYQLLSTIWLFVSVDDEEYEEKEQEEEETALISTEKD